MPTFIVDYDLNAPGQDYSKIIARMKELGTGNFNFLKSSWFVYHPRFSSKELFDYLSTAIDKNDKILVVQIASNYYGTLSKEAWEWLSKAFKLA